MVKEFWDRKLPSERINFIILVAKEQNFNLTNWPIMYQHMDYANNDYDNLHIYVRTILDRLLLPYFAIIRNNKLEKILE